MLLTKKNSFLHNYNINTINSGSTHVTCQRIAAICLFYQKFKRVVIQWVTSHCNTLAIFKYFFLSYKKAWVDIILYNHLFSSEYFDHNHNIKPTGTPIRLPRLARTFQAIADDPLSFYVGSLAEDVIADITDAGEYLKYCWNFL